MSQMTPREIVQELDKHIIGQDDAKRAVAIALRNRWRRSAVDEPLRQEITPKNILMIGPTGVGKTEIARRLARLVHAPFVKVEASKLTEVGYVGREVDSIIKDLADVSMKLSREREVARLRHRAEDGAEERVLDALLPGSKRDNFAEAADASSSDTRQKFRKMLREGKLDEREIEIEVSATPASFNIMTPPGMEDLSSQIQNMFQGLNQQQRKTRRVTVREAMKLLTDDEAARMVNEEELQAKAMEAVEQSGIVFIDEIDKVTRRADAGASGADVSREGVQRDLLPLVEGCTVNTKYGMIKTDHVLFIASGAFHLSKPSDLIPELQGRFPIRVEMNALTSEHFQRILTETDGALCEQYSALMATENVTLRFAEDGVRRIAEVAFHVNERMENIGARRLHTVMERLLEEVSFHAADWGGREIVIDAAYVDQHLGDLLADEDLTRYVL